MNQSTINTQPITISIAHATRRAEQAIKLRELWLGAARQPDQIEWIFGIDSDDSSSRAALENARAKFVVVHPGGCCAAFNAAAAITTGQLIIGACDDVQAPDGWDELLLQRLQADRAPSAERGALGSGTLPPAVVLVGDGFRQDKLATLAIITRAWYDRFGYLFPPEFVGLGADIWLTERAIRDGSFLDYSDIVFEHRHPFYGKAPSDAVYEKQNSKESRDHAGAVVRKLLEPLPIALCMIVGNEENVILRCLESAAGAFDGLCIVQATGTLPADRTLDLARAWCLDHGKTFSSATYRNQWPGLDHVDDFAAARNLSFRLADGLANLPYWLIWLDADDLLDPENCDRIREASGNSRFAGQFFRYVMGDGDISKEGYYRERLIRRGAGIWQDPVHETCAIHGLTCKVPEIAIRHCPPPGPERERRSASRNLAILERAVANTARQLFYHHQELFRLGREAEARAAGERALAVLPADMRMECYEICLNLCDLDVMTDRWMFKAIEIDPFRREAVAYLVQFALRCNDPRAALQYLNWLDSIPQPHPRPCNHRQMWYAWGRNYLRVRVLRAINKPEKADAEHAEYSRDPQYVELWESTAEG